MAPPYYISFYWQSVVLGVSMFFLRRFMKIFLESILPTFAKYSERLDKLTILIDEPWVIVNEDEVFKKFIFQKNGKVLISENGKVSFGTWKLLDKANAILMEHEGNLTLYNHVFLDEGLLILKLDGGVDYMCLANENVVPGLDIERYLERKLQPPSEKLSNTPPAKAISSVKTNGGVLMITHESVAGVVSEGDLVVLNGMEAPNGKYKLGPWFYIYVEEGRVRKTSMF